jgi:hypothetical protein
LKADIQIGIATEVRIMKIDIRSRSQAAMQIVLLAGVVLASLLLPSRAAAALGGEM